ncbi:MAG: site-specific DNA-methyltransferase, partial [Proteobacteria bacterium]|nr:site-specific DNA-methyltransferase [Pseudomonadota bacterium]
MARKKSAKGAANAETAVLDYRHDEAKRKNIPPAGLAAQGKVRETPKLRYTYDPHLPPVLRFDPAGGADRLPELLDTARSRPLTAEETQLLADALRNREPWLEWSGKREKKSFEVDPVALHIHERISTQAILKVIAREDVQRDLFADPQMEYQKAVQFYQHDVDWSNRMILGDSLQVMASLARREDLAGKVQMIYMDPPYGIKFASNFQPEIGKRDVKDKESDLTREPEMVKAYRDTWTLGVHSYLAYLRDRLILCKELLNDTGSIFVQISDENLHRVRCLMDEVFSPNNFCALITFFKTTSQTSTLLAPSTDYLLWYAKDVQRVKYKQLFQEKTIETDKAGVYNWVEERDGKRRRMSKIEKQTITPQSENRIFRLDTMTSQSGGETTSFQVELYGKSLSSGKGFWKTNREGMQRLLVSEKVVPSGITLAYIRFIEDFPAYPFSNLWTDTGTGSFTDEKVYVVQTGTKVIERCMLMTTDPGDLVLDPTCGSGTTAYVAEQWGRRWITIDTSRVALSLARQRLLTATYPFYRVKDGSPDAVAGEGETDLAADPRKGFIYKTVPHITLKSIAQNVALDPIFARHEPILEERLAALNAALKGVTPEIHRKLTAKLAVKERTEGKKSVTDADRRRWSLPKEAWKPWEVPFDADDDWPEALKNALTAYRQSWRAKMDEINACIAGNAEQEDLVDQPEVVRHVARVSGPFTMEAVMPAAESLAEESPIGGSPVDGLDTFGGDSGAIEEPVNAEAYLDKMLRLLRADGVRFPNNKVLSFSRLDACSSDYLHAEGEWTTEDGQPRTVAASFGPQFGPVTAWQVEQALPAASRRGFQDLIFAGFSFDAAAQAIIQEDPNPKVRCHLAHIRPDVNMGALLKEMPNSQLFTVFGSPRTHLKPAGEGEFIVEMEGVDIYNPVDNTLLPTNADKVAAWFLDTDYDGRTFCITQAFLPDKSAWGRIARALKGVIDEERFAALSGTVSLPFPAGRHRRVAVKVIDPR